MLNEINDDEENTEINLKEVDLNEERTLFEIELKKSNTKDDISLHINRIYGNIKYIDFLVPAILGMTIMMSCMMGMGSTIAGERETGELARLFMTPTSVATVIGGKIAAKLLIELVRAIILIFMAVILFNVWIKGGFFQTFIGLVIGAQLRKIMLKFLFHFQCL